MRLVGSHIVSGWRSLQLELLSATRLCHGACWIVEVAKTVDVVERGWIGEFGGGLEASVQNVKHVWVVAHIEEATEDY